MSIDLEVDNFLIDGDSRLKRSKSISSAGKENVGRWTKEEHELFLEGLKLYGKEWKKIAHLIGTRTIIQVRTHAQKFFQKMKTTSNSTVDYSTFLGNNGRLSTSDLSLTDIMSLHESHPVLSRNKSYSISVPYSTMNTSQLSLLNTSSTTAYPSSSLVSTTEVNPSNSSAGTSSSMNSTSINPMNHYDNSTNNTPLSDNPMNQTRFDMPFMTSTREIDNNTILSPYSNTKNVSRNLNTLSLYEFNNTQQNPFNSIPTPYSSSDTNMSPTFDFTTRPAASTSHGFSPYSAPFAGIPMNTGLPNTEDSMKNQDKNGISNGLYSNSQENNKQTSYFNTTFNSTTKNVPVLLSNNIKQEASSLIFDSFPYFRDEGVSLMSTSGFNNNNNNNNNMNIDNNNNTNMNINNNINNNDSTVIDIDNNNNNNNSNNNNIISSPLKHIGIRNSISLPIGNSLYDAYQTTTNNTTNNNNTNSNNNVYYESLSNSMQTISIHGNSPNGSIHTTKDTNNNTNNNNNNNNTTNNNNNINNNNNNNNNNTRPRLLRSRSQTKPSSKYNTNNNNNTNINNKLINTTSIMNGMPSIPETSDINYASNTLSLNTMTDLYPSNSILTNNNNTNNMNNNNNNNNKFVLTPPASCMTTLFDLPEINIDSYTSDLDLKKSASLETNNNNNNTNNINTISTIDLNMLNNNNTTTNNANNNNNNTYYNYYNNNIDTRGTEISYQEINQLF